MRSRLPVYLSSAATCMLVLLGTHASAQGRGAEVRDAAQQLREAEAHREAANRFADVLLEAQRQGGVQPGGRGGRGAPSSQTAAPLPSDPLSGPVVTNAPYSGDAVTTVTQTLGDGTRIEQAREVRIIWRIVGEDRPPRARSLRRDGGRPVRADCVDELTNREDLLAFVLGHTRPESLLQFRQQLDPFHRVEA